MKHPNIKNWKNLCYKIISKSIPPKNSNIVFLSKTPLKFSTILNHTINNNPVLTAIYTRLFGSEQKEVVEITTLIFPIPQVTQLQLPKISAQQSISLILPKFKLGNTICLPLLKK